MSSLHSDNSRSLTKTDQEGDAIVAFVMTNEDRIEGKNIRLPAGIKGTWELTVKVGKRGIKQGGGIAVTELGFWFGSWLQRFNPKARDYVTAETSGDAKLEPITNERSARVKAVVKEGTLAQGEKITIRIGDRQLGGVGSIASPIVTQGTVTIGVDVDGSGRYEDSVTPPLNIEFVSHPRVTRYYFTAPSIVALGEEFSVNVAAMDMNGNLIKDFEGNIKFQPNASIQGLPSAYLFKKDDYGAKRFTGLKATATGVHRIQLIDEEHGVAAESNPIKCLPKVNQRIYWGDLHAHGYDANSVWLSMLNSVTHPDSCHRYARNVANLDFCSISPMDPPPPEEAEEMWKLYREATRNWNKPGEYVTFVGPEWHGPKGGERGKGGDRTFIFKNEDLVIPHPSWPIEELYARYGEDNNVIMLAHLGGYPPDWRYYHPKQERLVEVASCHGNSEWILQEALSRGYRVGVVGSTDSHWGTPAHPRRVEIKCGRFRTGKVLTRRDSGCGTGFAAVIASSLTRDGIFEAFHSRRTYTTTGARILLEFEVNGKPMGEELKVRQPPLLRVEVHGTAPIERVDVIRNRSLLKSVKGNGKDLGFEFADDSLPTGESYYYIRVVQIDLDYAWSSPIWVFNEGLGFKPFRPGQWEVPWNRKEPVDLAELRPNEAEKYEEDLKWYLSNEEDPSKFRHITPVKIVHSPMGDYALFYGYLAPSMTRISIKWFYQFEIPRIRLEPDWMDYGSRPAEELIVQEP